MGVEQFDTIRKFSKTLKVGLSCEVSEEQMLELSKLNESKGIQLEKAKDQHTYDVIIGRGKIIATTIYKMNLDQLTIGKIVEVCQTIASPYVWSVTVAQSVKPNAWYSKAVGRNMFVYRDGNDFLTEPMSGKKVWELDVRNCDTKYAHDVQLIKKIDLNSTEALLDVIKYMAEFGKFKMSFGVTVSCPKSIGPPKVENWYTKDPKIAWKIAEKMRAVRNCEMAVIDIIDDAESSALSSLDHEDRYKKEAGRYVFNAKISMRMLVTYETDEFKGDISFLLNSCTDGKLDDFSYNRSSIQKDDKMEMSKRFMDLVQLAELYPKQILQNCWLESLK